MEQFVLSESERKILHAALEALAADFTLEPTAAGEEPIQISIRAESIRRLLFGLPVKETEDADLRSYIIPSSGLAIHGARIDGPLLLDGLRGPGGSSAAALRLVDCHVAEPISLRDAHIDGLSLERSRITYLCADGAKIESPVNLNHVRSAESIETATDESGQGLCWMQFKYAHLAGLRGAGANLSPPKQPPVEYALNLLGATVHGDVVLAPNLTTYGGISFNRAHIAGSVEMDGAQIQNAYGRSVSAQNASIGGYFAMRLDEGYGSNQRFTAIGEINLLCARIVGNLQFDGANISGEINARLASIGGNVRLTAVSLDNVEDNIVFYSASSVNFSNSQVNGNFDLSGACIEENFDANSIKVNGTMMVYSWSGPSGKWNFFLCKGRVNLSRSECGVIEFFDARLDGGVELTGCKVAGLLRFLLMPPAAREDGSYPVINLADAWARSFSDDNGLGIPPGYRLILEGFEYSKINAPMIGLDGKSMMRLPESEDYPTSKFETIIDRQFPGGIINQEYFIPGVYDKLSSYLRSEGLYSDSRKILRKKLDIERRYVSSFIIRPITWLYAKLFDYGLSPSRAVVTFSICILIGWAGAEIADHGFNVNYSAKGAIPVFSGLPTIAPVLVVSTNSVNSIISIDKSTGLPVQGAPFQPTSPPGMEVPCGRQIDPLLFAVDNFVPGLNLQQREKCEITTDPVGKVWHIFEALYSALGWIITSITVLTISGILRRQAES